MWWCAWAWAWVVPLRARNKNPDEKKEKGGGELRCAVERQQRTKDETYDFPILTGGFLSIFCFLGSGVRVDACASPFDCCGLGLGRRGSGFGSLSWFLFRRGFGDWPAKNQWNAQLRSRRCSLGEMSSCPLFVVCPVRFVVKFGCEMERRRRRLGKLASGSRR